MPDQGLVAYMRTLENGDKQVAFNATNEMFPTPLTSEEQLQKLDQYLSGDTANNKQKKLMQAEQWAARLAKNFNDRNWEAYRATLVEINFYYSYSPFVSVYFSELYWSHLIQLISPPFNNWQQVNVLLYFLPEEGKEHCLQWPASRLKELAAIRYEAQLWQISQMRDVKEITEKIHTLLEHLDENNLNVKKLITDLTQVNAEIRLHINQLEKIDRKDPNFRIQYEELVQCRQKVAEILLILADKRNFKREGKKIVLSHYIKSSMNMDKKVWKKFVQSALRVNQKCPNVPAVELVIPPITPVWAQRNKLRDIQTVPDFGTLVDQTKEKSARRRAST